MHLAVEHGRKPLSFLVTAGQRHDSPQFQPVLERIRVPRTGVGRPRRRPGRVRADKAYGLRAKRDYLHRRGIRSTIPEKSDQIRNRKRLGVRGGHPPRFTRPTTASATRSSTGSTASSAIGRWPPGTTSRPSATKPPSRSPSSTSGSDLPARPRSTRNAVSLQAAGLLGAVRSIIAPRARAPVCAGCGFRQR
ncbi:transposase [Actinacidiphila glaucinigra]|uniref:transposase n=1 Tax=Actinacidiphila glaucinigra TaxID=235986 RepID=UPI0033AE939A